MKYSKEQVLLIERVHLDFVRAGAKFDAEAQLKYGKIMENLAVLTTKFAQVQQQLILVMNEKFQLPQVLHSFRIAIMKLQNILEDESKFTIDLKVSDLTGLPDSVIATAKETAVERKKADG